MIAGIDDDDVMGPDRLARRLFQVVIGDRLPFLLGDRDHKAGAEKIRQRHFVDEGRPLHDVSGRIDVLGVVHAGRDPLREHARLRHVMDALDLDVLG